MPQGDGETLDAIDGPEDAAVEVGQPADVAIAEEGTPPDADGTEEPSDLLDAEGTGPSGDAPADPSEPGPTEADGHSVDRSEFSAADVQDELGPSVRTRLIPGDGGCAIGSHSHRSVALFVTALALYAVVIGRRRLYRWRARRR